MERGGGGSSVACWGEGNRGIMAPGLSMIQYRKVTVIYPNGTQALSEVDLRVGKGEFVFLVGPTGEGKSTLLRLAYRGVLPSSGQVVVAGKDVGKMPMSRVPYLRREMGVVFQDFRLLPDKTVWENVAFALQVVGMPKREVHRRVPELLEQVSLGHKATCFPSELSGGEQQRTCIARALANHPPLLLADEPTGNLDPQSSLDTVELLSRINDTGTTVVVATHDQAIVDRMQRRVVAVDGGRIVGDEVGGYPEEGR